MKIRLQIEMEGRLQGVGFRPFVYRLAQDLNLSGWIRNTLQGVLIEVQGNSFQVERCENLLRKNLPSHATVRTFKRRELDLQQESSFQILPSLSSGADFEEILPDIAVCKKCIDEVFDPTHRLYRYPFVSCTDCGPRYSILEKSPYDRCHTAFAQFEMCDICRAEYENPIDRRFYAQTHCCPECGPSLELLNKNGQVLERKNDALLAAVNAIREGLILAVKGVGGFHLLCDWKNDDVILKLRHLKQRDFKPFALMVESVEVARQFCELSEFEERLLQDPKGPIVLLNKRKNSQLKISEWVAPGIQTFGVLLPYTSLHHLLLREWGSGVIVTSGNQSDEPLCIDIDQALFRLKGIADLFLSHDRPIVSRVDDSVVREIAGSEVVFRAGRGYAPKLLRVSGDFPDILALGGQQKSTISASKRDRIILYPHLGNLETFEAMEIFRASALKIKNIFKLPNVVSDLHPDYRSTQVGEEFSSNLIRIQHHEAHLLSCMAEHELRGPAFGVAWDGTGFGRDGTIWGGEFFRGSEQGFSRIASFRPFHLFGGEVAIRDARRTAFGLLFEVFGKEIFKERLELEKIQPWLKDLTEKEWKLWIKAMEYELNSCPTSSVGRLFDGIGVLVGLSPRVDYEGQKAVELEALGWGERGETFQEIILKEGEELTMVDWEPWIREILEDRRNGVSSAKISAKFHYSLAHCILIMAKKVGIRQVVLSGGCFQNRVLAEWTIDMLKKEGFIPYWNQSIPPNDGGISVGQILGASHVLISASAIKGSHWK